MRSFVVVRRPSSCFLVVAQRLRIVVCMLMQGLSCPMACGILLPQPGIEPMSPATEGRFPTSGLPGKSPWSLLKNYFFLLFWIRSIAFLSTSIQTTRRRQWHPTPVLLPGKIPWMEEPGGPQSMGSQRVGHDWVTKTLIQSTHFLTMRNKFVYSDSVKAMLQDWTNSWKAFSASCWLWKCFLHKKLLRCLKKW